MNNRVKAAFVGRDGIRAGWRLLLFVLGAWIAAQILFAILTHGFGYKPQEGWHPFDFTIEGILNLIVILSAAALMTRIEKKSFADYGLPFGSAFGFRFWWGLLWGFLASTLVFLATWAAGGVTFSGFALHGRELVMSALVWIPAWLMLGLFEEFFYRGYALATLSSSMGFWPTSFLLSAIFGALHYFVKPMESWMDALNVGLFGLFWCFTLRRTGDLWFAIGFHAISDYADLMIYAAPNTGNNGMSLTGHLLNVTYHGPSWLTGGVCGMEASVITLVALAALFALFHRLCPMAQFPAATH